MAPPLRRAQLRRALPWAVPALVLLAVTATVLPAGAASLAAAGPAASGPASKARDAAAQPLILDTDLSPGVACDQPVKARISVYHPKGVSSRETVEWRL